ncbi:MAG: hypothetical protein KIT20_03555 [Alphaproteobacteria bacterium]|nr:hypothetical protein [Alphaproteobacteria bacterium]
MSAFGASRRRPAFLYLPIEIAARELDSKLLIAHFALRLGMEVLFGQKWLMQANIAALPPGLWIFKTLTPGDSRHMEIARAHGNRIAAIDEEMPGLGEDCGDLRWVSRKALEACDVTFCLGGVHQAALMRKFPEYQAKYEITGNPRWDLLRPELRAFYEAEAASIRREHGRFILINTNIGLMNSAKSTPEEVIRTLERHGKIDLSLAKDRAFIDYIRDFESRNLAACIDLIPILADAFPDHRIVLRPHPTEKTETYAAALAGNPRAILAASGSAAPWILASEALVHTSCTTGTEAFALGKPSITYQTLDSPRLSYFLSNSLNHAARSNEDVVDLLRRVLAMDGAPALAYPQAMHETFRRFFAAQEGAFASERIAVAAGRRLGLAAPDILPGDRALWRPGPRYRFERRSTAYQQQLFPDMDASVIADRLGEIADILGHERSVSVVKCGEGQYHLHDARLERPEPVRRRNSWFVDWLRPQVREAG